MNILSVSLEGILHFFAQKGGSLDFTFYQEDFGNFLSGGAP